MTTLLSLFCSLAIISAKDPYGLHKESKKVQVKNVIRFAEKSSKDPYELLAIAITESSLNPKAYSHTKDSGLFQVNCRWWYKKFNYPSIKVCEKDMLIPDKNIPAAIYILDSFRKKYKQCRGELGYHCYNGGQGWPRSKNKERILKYGKRIKERKQILHHHYRKMIEDIRLRYRGRS